MEFKGKKKKIKERKAKSEKQDQIEEDDAHDVLLGEPGDDPVRQLDDQCT